MLKYLWCWKKSHLYDSVNYKNAGQTMNFWVFSHLLMIDALWRQSMLQILQESLLSDV